MYECWAWVAPYGKDYEWIQGFDVGTQRGVTVFRPLVTIMEDEYSVGFFCEDWQLSYGREKPTHKGSDTQIIQQSLEVM